MDKRTFSQKGGIGAFGYQELLEIRSILFPRGHIPI